MSQWYYLQNNQQQGPVSSRQLKHLADSGQLQSSNLIWKEGMSQWAEARNVKGLFRTQTAANPLSPTAPDISRLPLGAESPSLNPSADILADVAKALDAGRSPQGFEAYLEEAVVHRLVAWQAAAEAGVPAAEWLIGLCFSEGYGVGQDDALAVKWCRKAAERGYTPAQNHLGLAYVEGKGVPQDYAEAAAWFRKAAEQGLPGAQCNLGVSCVEGKGVPQDYAEAAAWFRKAAEQGHVRAQYSLGICHWHGKGVPRTLRRP